MLSCACVCVCDRICGTKPAQYVTVLLIQVAFLACGTFVCARACFSFCACLFYGEIEHHADIIHVPVHILVHVYTYMYISWPVLSFLAFVNLQRKQTCYRNSSRGAHARSNSAWPWMTMATHGNHTLLLARLFLPPPSPRVFSGAASGGKRRTYCVESTPILLSILVRTAKAAKEVAAVVSGYILVRCRLWPSTRPLWRAPRYYNRAISGGSLLCFGHSPLLTLGPKDFTYLELYGIS